MLSVSEAVQRLLDAAEPMTPPEPVPTIAALGRTLAADLAAPIDVPPCDNSAMDGYALRHADWMGPDTDIPLSQRVTAGSRPDPLQAGTAARIFTGACIPPGADTVVMQEHCEGSAEAVSVRKLPDRGANIRARGQDITRGQGVLRTGRRLRPQDLGLAASLSIDRLQVYRPLRVAVVSTGDELVEPGEPAHPGQIYNSNRFIMTAQLSTWGFDVVELGIVRDDPAAVRSTLAEAADRADVILTSGGVSVGEEDHVRGVVAALGAIDLWRIAIKPGKPLAFGRVGDTPFIGLPGNPVSVFVTLLVIARPFLLTCQGAGDTRVVPLSCPATFSREASSRDDYLRVRRGEGGLELFSNPSSGVLFSTVWGDGLLRQPAGEEIRKGGICDYFPWQLFA